MIDIILIFINIFDFFVEDLGAWPLDLHLGASPPKPPMGASPQVYNLGTLIPKPQLKHLQLVYIFYYFSFKIIYKFIFFYIFNFFKLLFKLIIFFIFKIIYF